MGNLRLLLCTTFFVLVSVSAVFASDPKTVLEDYIKQGTPVEIGTCDDGMSILTVLAGSDFKMMVFFAPMSSLDTSYVVVTPLDGGKEYFIRLDRSGEVTVRKLDAMHWSKELMRESMNFFRYLFFPDKPHDCGTGIL